MIAVAFEAPAIERCAAAFVCCCMNVCNAELSRLCLTALQLLYVSIATRCTSTPGVNGSKCQRSCRVELCNRTLRHTESVGVDQTCTT
eukprot:3877-Heterococcus_DN1.PRE.2